MRWREYDERAKELESRLQDKLPLFDWRVMSAADRAAYWRTLGMMDFSDWCIRASVVVNGHKCRAMTIIDSVLMHDASFDYVDVIAHQMAHEFAQKFMTWAPDK